MEGEDQPPSNNDQGHANPAPLPIPAPQAAAEKRRLPEQANKNTLRDPMFWLLLGTLIATGFAASFTRKQWLTADDQERRSLRAYIGGTSKPVDLRCADCEKPPAINTNWDRNFIGFEIKNFGMTPAYKLTARLSFKDMPYGQSLPKDFDYADAALDTGIFPMSETILNPQDTTVPGNLISPTQTNLIIKARNHDVTLYVYGHVDFTDAFRKQRSVPFCLRYFPDTDEPSHRWGCCPDHNNPSDDD